MSEGKRGPKRKPAGGVGVSGNMLMLNANAVELLTNGGRETIRYVAVMRLPNGDLALRPVETPEGAVTMVQLINGRISAACLPEVSQGKRLTALWNDADEQLELTARPEVLSPC